MPSWGHFWGSRRPCRRQLRAVKSHLGVFEDSLQATKTCNRQRERPEREHLTNTLVFLRFLFVLFWFLFVTAPSCRGALGPCKEVLIKGARDFFCHVAFLIFVGFAGSPNSAPDSGTRRKKKKHEKHAFGRSPNNAPDSPPPPKKKEKTTRHGERNKK